jgi:hypothetical protein
LPIFLSLSISELFLEYAQRKITANNPTTKKPESDIKNKLLLIPPSKLLPKYYLAGV